MACWSVSSMNKTSKLISEQVPYIFLLRHVLFVQNVKYSNISLKRVNCCSAVYSELPRVTTFGRLTTAAGCR